MNNYNPSPLQATNAAWGSTPDANIPSPSPPAPTPANMPSSGNSSPVGQLPFPSAGSIPGGYPPPGTYPPPGAYPPPNGYLPHPYPYLYPYPLPEQDKRRDLALAGMIVGIFSIVLCTSVLFGLACSITGIVLSVMGRRSTTRRTMANVGLGLSITGLVLAVCVIAFFGLYFYFIFHLMQTLPHTSSNY